VPYDRRNNHPNATVPATSAESELTIVDHPIMIWSRQFSTLLNGPTSSMSLVSVPFVPEQYSCRTGTLPSGCVGQLNGFDRANGGLHEILIVVSWCCAMKGCDLP
jgi:hypothetical protein